ncbi:hypothetical protein GGI05_004545, partial [Coemansia sp. RSA 2603]
MTYFAHPANLPAEILTPVLKAAIDSEPDSQSAQIALRKLRSVCSAWFESGEQLDRWTVKVWLHPDNDHPETLYHTNMEKIERCGGQKLVESIQLFAQADTLFRLRDSVLSILGDISAVCPGVTALSIFAAEPVYSGNGFVLHNEHVSLFQPFAADIARMFPRLNELELDLPGYSCESWGLGASIIENYASQLQKL